MSETDAASPCQPRAEPEELPDQCRVVNGPSGESTFVHIAQNDVAVLKPLVGTKSAKRSFFSKNGNVDSCLIPLKQEIWVSKWLPLYSFNYGKSDSSVLCITDMNYIIQILINSSFSQLVERENFKIISRLFLHLQ